LKLTVGDVEVLERSRCRHLDAEAVRALRRARQPHRRVGPPLEASRTVEVVFRLRDGLAVLRHGSPGLI